MGTAVRDLAEELADCRRLLVRARELERRRLVTALAGVTADRLTALRRQLAAAAMALSLGEDAGPALGRALADLDELLDRFRGIARGVYPAVLRDQGPFAALDELSAGLPRPVVLDGGLRARLAWEIESGLYHPAAAAVTELAGQPGATPLRVRFAHADGRLSVRIDDPAPGRAAEQVAAGLRDEAERLAALGGDLTVAAQPGLITVAAWVPERLGPDLSGVPEADLAAARAQAEAIASARREAVAAMDSERRAVERDLHDGAQHHLVALRLALGMVEFEVGQGLVDTARDRLAMLADRVAEAELVLAETAAGLSPAALTEGGLAAALAAERDGAGRGVEVVAQARRFPPEVESAVYFCCLEAVGNARRHAPQAAVRVEVGVAGGVLRFSVRDDGPGFVPGTASGGRGLANMATRMAGVGGTVVVESVPGAGTTVAGTVPLMPA
ncbi:ATP-binding protein [Pseudonocardia sp.]|uniref:sensor histidine kinase n=1 Tax=Pseudonocardia sp. TaxID=60912 RepID=UPI003D1457DC